VHIVGYYTGEIVRFTALS